ncbi:MAG: M28 family peptidase [candidate division WOR-3 bacterium]
MKKSVLTFLIVIGLGFAGEFLAIVPDVQPEQLKDLFNVVGVTGNGVLVIGSEQDEPVLNNLNGRILDYNPRDKIYYQVHLFDWAKREQLAQISQILDFDGDEYLVAVKPENVEKLLSLRVMLARITLQPWVFKPVKFEPPPVFSNPLIEQMVGAVSPDSVLSYVNRLQRYRTRYSTSDSCRAAAEWIRQKFINYGCDSVYFQYHTTGHAPNVIGIRYGTSGQRNPYAIICGHFDSYASSNAPGADDNASGTAAVIEAARVTQGYLFTYDLRFIAFSGEEFGLYGSEYYAGQARSQGDSILGVLNFDMIGYVDAEPENLDVMGKINNPPCEPFVNWFTAIADTYTTLPIYKRMVNDNQNSDHGPFWNNGYLAFCGIEDFWPVNPYYHTPGDSIGAGYNNNDFCTEVTKAGVAGLATLAQPLPLNMPLLGLLRIRIDDFGGNNFWDPGESIAVYLTLKNFGTVAGHNVSALLSTTDTFVTTLQDSSLFGDIAGGDTAICSTPYLLLSSTQTPREHQAGFSLTIFADESTYQTSFNLQIGQYLITDPIPDGPRWPPLYWAYDDIDTGYTEHPVFEWIEINTVGTRLTFPHNDSVKVIPLPEGFGPFRFYGQEYDSLSISADGWLCPGFYRQPRYTNQPLPSSQTPPGVICVNWDDLYPDYNNTGFVYWYYDTLGHRLIVEYDSVCYYNPRTLRDKFQVIIYDTTITTPTGDNVIVFQYLTANGYTSSTVGIQDQTRQIAIQCLYNGSYAHGAAAIAPQRAIKFTTVEPLTGIAAPQPKLLPKPVVVLPNPARNFAEIRLSPTTTPAKISLYDRTGRLMKTLLLPRGKGSLYLDCRNLESGVYFIKTNSTGSPVKLLVVH